MAHKATAMSFALVFMAMFWARGMAQSSCTNTLISMSPCLNYITGNSSTPSSQCCTQLASVVRSSPECLCQVLNGGGSSLGLNINQTQALALPSACSVQTPPLSSGMWTAASPAASPGGTPEGPTSSTPSGTGSKTVPSTETDNTSDGNSIKFSLLAVLLFAAYSFTFTAY